MEGPGPRGPATRLPTEEDLPNGSGSSANPQIAPPIAITRLAKIFPVGPVMSDWREVYDLLANLDFLMRQGQGLVADALVGRLA